MRYLLVASLTALLAAPLVAAPDASRVEAAGEGDSTAQYELGRDYMLGRGVAVDIVAGRQWLYEAARNGHAGAQDYFGVSRGMGAPGRKRLRKAAKKGDALAQYFLAERLTAFSPESDREVLQWYRTAAESGVPAAKLELARRYLSGQGTSADREEGRRWLIEAADATDQAYTLLGNLHFEMGEQDPEGARWYIKAAEGGDAFAQMMLGIMYAEGRGVPRDLVQSLSWLKVAAESGQLRDDGLDAVFSVLTRSVTEQMSDEQVERALSLAAQRRTAQ